MSPEENERFEKDALLHKLQDENEQLKFFKKEAKRITKGVLYRFIDYYTQDELERLDIRFVADKFLEESDSNV